MLMDEDEDWLDAAAERLAEAREEFREPKRWRGCRDRMCGATDCPTCFPTSYDQEKEKDSELEEKREK